MVKRISLSILVVFLLLIVLFVLVELNNNNPLTIIKYNQLRNKLASGSNIFVFRVSFQGLLPMGEARLENKGEELYHNKKVYHLSAKAYPLSFFSKLINAKVEADSYVDMDKLYTLNFKQNLILPNKPEDEKDILYNQSEHVMELRGIKRQILPDTQDPLSTIFYIRNQNLEIGKVFDININTNQKNYQFYAKVIKREEYALESGKIGVWVLKGIIVRRDKNPYHKTALKIWLLDTPSKAPLLIKTMTSVGQITARLIGVE